MRRISVVGLIGVIGVVAVGLAALRSGSDLSRKAIHTLTLSVLTVSLLGAIVRPRPRGAWMGFALFSWTYFLLGIPPSPGLAAPGMTMNGGQMLTADLMDGLSRTLHREPPIPPGFLAGPTPGELLQVRGGMAIPVDLSAAPNRAAGGYFDRFFAYQMALQNTPRIGQLLLCLALGAIGSILGRTLSARRGTDLRTPV